MIIQRKKEIIKMRGGLRELPSDSRDFSRIKVFGMGSLPPNEDFMVAEPISIEDQKETDFCTAFALSAVAEDQEGVDLDPLYTFAKIKQIEGDWRSWGADLRSACKAAVKFGFIKKENSPFDLDNYSRDIVANWENWPKELDDLAKKHRKMSYFRVDDSVDTFNAFRAALWQNKAKKCSIFTGTTWRENWNNVKDGIIPDEPGPPLFGHAIKIFGQKIIIGEPYLIAQQSLGKKEGDNGLLYFSRKVINRDFKYGAFIQWLEKFKKNNLCLLKFI